MTTKLAHKIKIYERTVLKDNRGWFLKFINGKEDELPSYTGEIYFTCANPGKNKGGHYHHLANEWFCPVSGKGVLKLIDIESHEISNIELDSKNPVSVFVPPLIAHLITNASENEEFILCAYTDRLYQPEDTISYDF